MMHFLTRSLKSHAPRALISVPITTNAGLRTLTTQCARYWASREIHSNGRNNAFNPSLSSIQTLRPFSTSTSLLKKKKGKTESDDGGSAAAEPAAGGGEDPFDFSTFEDTIRMAVERFKSDVSKLRTGGRFNPELLEGLRVVVDKNSKETVRFGDLAQVIPKGGRMVTVLVGDEEYVKPISSAIASSQLSLNAQPDSHNSLQLNVPIPPPTKETREASLRDAKNAMEKAADAVRSGRLTVNKKLQSMGKAKTVRPDDLRKAKDMMEKITTKGQKEVQDIFSGAKKVLEQA